MDLMVKESDRLLKKQKICSQKTTKELNALITGLGSCSALLTVDDDTVMADAEPHHISEDVLAELSERVRGLKRTSAEISTSHKELYGYISKLGKAIDKTFTINVSDVSNPEALTGLDNQLNESIAQHLFRRGRFGIGETFVKEAELDVNVDKEPFREMYSILERIKAHDLTPALSWAMRNGEALAAIDSDLEFKLHRLYYITLLVCVKDNARALKYAREHFHKFKHDQMSEIRKLMGALIYMDRLQASPYAKLASDDERDCVHDLFVQDYCKLLGMSHHSALSTALNTGCKALPTLLKLASVMQNKKDHMWSQKDELPVEIDVGKDHQYHSVFACPVSREQTTAENPPMRLPCGHVIAKVSLRNLSKGVRFKCPYCPQEQTPADAVQIYF